MSRGGRGYSNGPRRSGPRGLPSVDGHHFAVDSSLDIKLFPTLQSDLQTPTFDAKIAEKIQYQSSFLESMKTSPFYLDFPPVKANDVEAYSDRYKVSNKMSDPWPWKTLQSIPTDLQFYPEELQVIVDPTKVKTKSTTQRKRKEDVDALFEGVQEVDNKRQRTEEEDDALDDLALEYDEEEQEEDTDYAIAYYDDDLDVFEDGERDEEY